MRSSVLVNLEFSVRFSAGLWQDCCALGDLFGLWENLAQKTGSGWAWWHTPVILALGRLRQEDREFSQPELHSKILSQTKQQQKKKKERKKTGLTA
jgi:hypothetical protein